MAESGFDAGWRSIGTFFLWCIPYVLGAAALVWLGVFIGYRGLWNQLSQEKRSAIYVGAATRPKGKLQIETPNESEVKVTRVDLNGRRAAVYFRNEGNSYAGFIQVHWQLVSPDGTLLKSGYQFSENIEGPQELNVGEQGEVVFSDIEADSRAKSIRFWVKSNGR